VAAVVIVGAGVGGLCAAIRLSAAGHAVTVYEQAPRVGGKLAGLCRDGFAFDTGPSLLTWPEVLADTVAVSGARLGELLEPRRLDPMFRYRFADGTWLTVPDGGAAAVAEAMGDQLGGHAADDWLRFSRHAARLWDAVRGPFLDAPVRGPADLLRRAADLRAVRLIAPWRTLRATGRRFFRDPRQRMLLERYATYSGSDPRRAPGVLAVSAHLEQTRGAWHVPGGLWRIAGMLADRARATGAVIHTGTPVRAVTVDGTRVSGVRLAGGQRVAADVVVCNADAARLYGELLPGGDRTRPARRLRRATPSLSGFVLLLALGPGAAVPAHHTVLFPARYDDEFDGVFGPEPRPVADPAVYVCAPDDPAMRPSAAEQAWFVLVNAARQGTVDWLAPGLADRYADRVLGVLAERGLDVRDRVRWRVVRTPADLAAQTGAPGGSIYGSSSNGMRAAFLRPGNATPVRGLFLVGGSTHPGGGLPLVARSGEITARLVPGA
jgi:phytoene desaturase